jgi:hypothetical protein
VTVDDLAELLTTAGFRVAMPGDNTTALPRVVLSPVRMDLQPGGRLLYDVVDVCVERAASPWKEQAALVHGDTVEVLRALAGTSYHFDQSITFETDTDGTTPAVLYRINVRFAGPDLCPPYADEQAVWDAKQPGWNDAEWSSETTQE